MAMLPKKPDRIVVTIRVVVRCTLLMIPANSTVRNPAPCKMPPSAIAINASSKVQLMLLMPPRPSKASKLAMPVDSGVLSHSALSTEIELSP